MPVYGFFRGINNKESVERLKQPDSKDPSADLAEAVNVDIDGTGKVSRRDGFALKVSGSAHSLWSDGETCLCVKGGTLHEVKPDYTLTPLAVVGDEPMEYVEVNGCVYYTNGLVVGWVENGVANSFPAPTEQFKTRFPPCRNLATYRGRLFGSAGNLLLFSDAWKYRQIDERHGFKQFPTEIVMVAAGFDGVYVSTTDKTYFLQGDDPGKFNLQAVADVPAIQGTKSAIDGAALGRDGLQGTLPVWASKEGLCVGLPQGLVLNLTNSRYAMPETTKGAAVIDTNNGYHRYIATLR